MKWTEDLSVGIDEIDAQHRELFNRINALVDAIKQAKCKDVIDGTINFLEEYTLVHFGVEERYMEKYDYPEAEQHRAQHAIFLKALSDLKKQASEPRVDGASYDLSVTTNQVVVDWIVTHILRIDTKLGKFLQPRLG
jgi:hemerythrin